MLLWLINLDFAGGGQTSGWEPKESPSLTWAELTDPTSDWTPNSDPGGDWTPNS